MNAEYRCCPVLHDASHYLTPTLARQFFVDHWWNDSKRELSLKTLQVKDELQESNGQWVTRRLRGVCVFAAIQYGKSTATSKNGNRWLHTLLSSPLHSSARSLLKRSPSLFGSRAHILQAHSPNKLKTVAFLSRFIMLIHARCMPDTKTVPLDTHKISRLHDNSSEAKTQKSWHTDWKPLCHLCARELKVIPTMLSLCLWCGFLYTHRIRKNIKLLFL